MKAEWILNLKPGEDPEQKAQKWIREYNAFAEDFPDSRALADQLSQRVRNAAALLKGTHAADNLNLNGVPLGDPTDMAFVGSWFSLPELVDIQMGWAVLADGRNDAPGDPHASVRQGFLRELEGKWQDALRCYQQGPEDPEIRRRMQYCRERTTAEGALCYAKAQELLLKLRQSEALKLLNQAAHLGNIDATEQLALSPASKDREKALGLLRHAAGQNDPDACFALYRLYDQGIYPVQATEAERMLHQAADLGHAQAQTLTAEGTDLRPVRTILLEEIHAGSKNALWWMVQECEKQGDMEQAVEWLDKAIEANQLDALLATAQAYAEPGTEAYSRADAMDYYRRAARAGSLEALTALGDLELTDTHISFYDMALLLHSPDAPRKKPDQHMMEQHRKQLAWYTLAANAGAVGPMLALSDAYAQGYPVEQDAAQAFFWANQGAGAGDPLCMYKAARMLEQGNGVQQNLPEAVRLYEQAALEGMEQAAERLWQIYTTGLGAIHSNRRKAAFYLRRINRR